MLAIYFHIARHIDDRAEFLRDVRGLRHANPGVIWTPSLYVAKKMTAFYKDLWIEYLIQQHGLRDLIAVAAPEREQQVSPVRKLVPGMQQKSIFRR